MDLFEIGYNLKLCSTQNLYIFNDYITMRNYMQNNSDTVSARSMKKKMKGTTALFSMFFIAVFTFGAATAQITPTQEIDGHLLYTTEDPQDLNESSDVISLSVQQAILREMNKRKIQPGQEKIEKIKNHRPNIKKQNLRKVKKLKKKNNSKRKPQKGTGRSA